MDERKRSSEQRVFRVAFTPLFRLVIRSCLLVALLAFLVPPYPKTEPEVMADIGWNGGVAIIVASFISGIVWALLAILLPVKVTSGGIASRLKKATLGHSFLAWPEIDRVYLRTRYRVLGIPIVYVYRRDEKDSPLLVPLFLAQEPTFHTMVQNATSQLNPLRQFLDQEAEARKAAEDPSSP